MPRPMTLRTGHTKILLLTQQLTAIAQLVTSFTVLLYELSIIGRSFDTMSFGVFHKLETP